MKVGLLIVLGLLGCGVAPSGAAPAAGAQPSPPARAIVESPAGSPVVEAPHIGGSSAEIEPEPEAPILDVLLPGPHEVEGGQLAPTRGPVESADAYCAAFLHSAPPDRAFNAHITVTSSCEVVGRTSEPNQPAPLLDATPPFGRVRLVRIVAPYEYEPDRWDDFEEIRLAIETEQGVVVDERGLEISRALPASCVRIVSAVSEDVVAGGDLELRVELELFVGADEGVPERTTRYDVVCGTGPSGDLSCARYRGGARQASRLRFP